MKSPSLLTLPVALGLCLTVIPVEPADAAKETAVSSIASRSYSRSEAGRIVGRSALTSTRPVRAPIAPTPVDRVSIERTERYGDLVDRHAHQLGLDGDLVRAMIYAESGGDRKAISQSGAIGLMQLMPETAGELGIADPFDADASIGGGTRYLRGLMDRYGSTEVALWAYNAGPGAVARGHLPEETVKYVPRVLSLRKIFHDRREPALASQ
jgi:soluble lytic murein transglycosylase-like protein